VVQDDGIRLETDRPHQVSDCLNLTERRRSGNSHGMVAQGPILKLIFLAVKT
jgi:hypothetical protein